MSVIRDSTETPDSVLNVSREIVFGTAGYVVREQLTNSSTQPKPFRPHATATRQRRTDGRGNLVGVLKVSGLISVFAAVLAGLYFAERYVIAARPAGAGPVVLVDVPAWVSAELKSKVIRTAGRNLKLDEDAARTVAENLASVAWLDAVRVGLTHKEVRIEARWRKPLALIKPGRTSFYIDADRIVLDFVPMPSLPIVTVAGVSVARMPQPGQVFGQDDLAAAMALLALLDRMDKKMVPQKPLLGDIAGIDVSNFNGRKSDHDPHIVLYTKDNTQIVWGAEIGAWARHLEAKDEDKLAKLYTYYREHGTLSAGAKYINLRDPQDKIPQPIDKYR